MIKLKKIYLQEKTVICICYISETICSKAIYLLDPFFLGLPPMTTVWPYQWPLVTGPHWVDGVGACVINQVNQIFPLMIFSVSKGGKTQLFFLGKEVRDED